MFQSTRRQFVGHLGEGALAVSASRSIIELLGGQPESSALQISDVKDLRQVLQLAIKLEHATIPPYLCALFSIKPGQNTEVAGLIRSVVVEEMFHMVLACNLLNAIGGKPEIDRAGFVPTYPGRLPGGIRPDVTVRLRACSKEHIHDVFMAIEQPTEAVVPHGLPVPTAAEVSAIEVDERGNLSPAATKVAQQLALHFEHATHAPLTIGWFYQQVGKAFVHLSRAGDLFTGDPDLQVTKQVYAGAPGALYSITGTPKAKLHKALLALNEIERQGEGSSHTNPMDSEDDLGHYYRFQEIVEGRRMVQHGPGDWRFTGKVIPFDPDGVWRMVDDPAPGLLPRHTDARRKCEEFDGVYSQLLRTLHGMFNGNPQAFGKAVGLMYSLEGHAHELLEMPIAHGSRWRAGPAFRPS